jgi:mRNA interferase MazF
MIFKPFDIVELPFPFSDLSSSKKRKALVISSQSFNKANQAATVAMITSRTNSEWIGDVGIVHWHSVGLKKPCYIRLKFFTADLSIFNRKVGELHPQDQKNVNESFKLNILPD